MKKIIIVITALLGFTQGTFAAPRTIAPGSYNLEMTARPNECYPPLDQYNVTLTISGEGSAFPVKLSRHHIIPYNLLRGFYNKVIQQGKVDKIAGFLNKINEKAAEYGATKCTSDDIQGGASLAALIASKGVVHDSSQISPDYKDDFFSLYIWMPGNLFPGPQSDLRSDDPKEKLESRAGHIVGAEFSRYQQLYNDMNSYVSNPDDSKLASINANLEFIAGLTASYSLKSEDWIKEGSKYHLK